MIDKKMVNDKEIIFSSELLKNYDSTDFLKNYKKYGLTYDTIIKKDSMNNCFWRCDMDISKGDISIWKKEGNCNKVRLLANSIDNLSDHIYPGSSIRLILQFKKFYADKTPIDNSLTYGMSIEVIQIEFIPPKK